MGFKDRLSRAKSRVKRRYSDGGRNRMFKDLAMVGGLAGAAYLAKKLYDSRGPLPVFGPKTFQQSNIGPERETHQRADDWYNHFGRRRRMSRRRKSGKKSRKSSKKFGKKRSCKRKSKSCKRRKSRKH